VAQEIQVHEGYVAVVFSGTVDRDSVRGALEARPDARQAIATLRKVLFDFSAVKAFEFDPFQLGEAMRRVAGQGLRLAIASEQPEFFGVGRQIAQSSGMEGVAIAVFHTRLEAVAWLQRVGE